MRILFVCLGNICRSPMAQGILERLNEEKGLGWTIDSAGTGSWHVGECPDPRAVVMAASKGLNISRQRARQFKSSDFVGFDLIITMDEEVHRHILSLSPAKEQKEKVKRMMDFIYPGENREVPDPYMDDDGFGEVFDLLDQACSKLVKNYTGKKTPSSGK